MKSASNCACQCCDHERKIYTAQDAGKRIALQTQLDRLTRALHMAKLWINVSNPVIVEEIEAIEKGEK